MKSMCEAQLNSGCGQIAAGSILPHAQRRDGAARAEKKSEKSEKWFFAIFQLEPAADQLVPTKTRSGHFSDFSKNFRGYTGGRGQEIPILIVILILILISI
jgi:hypothetical protein